MKKHSDEAVEELKRIEKDTRIIEELSNRLQKIESIIENFSSKRDMNSFNNTETIKEIVTKITNLRDIIDRIEVEMTRLDSRINSIETLRFKRRTQG